MTSSPSYIPEGTPERKVLYEDPELGFTILAHGYVGAKGSKPHDHGPSWAIYGQAAGETIMTDWDCLARPNEGAPGKATRVRDYSMLPGDAYLLRHWRAALAASRRLNAAAAHRGHEHGSREALPLRGGGRAQPGRRIAFHWPVAGMICFSSTMKLLIRPMNSAPSSVSRFISGEAAARARAC